MLLFGDCLGVRGLQGVSRGSPEGPYRPHLCTHLWRTVPPPRGPTPKRNLGLSNYLTPVDLSSGFRAKRSERLAYRNFPIQTVQNRAAHKVNSSDPTAANFRQSRYCVRQSCLAKRGRLSRLRCARLIFAWRPRLRDKDFIRVNYDLRGTSLRSAPRRS